MVRIGPHLSNISKHQNLNAFIETYDKESLQRAREIDKKIARLNELEGNAVNDSEAVSSQREELEKLRKDAGELEMQRHRLEGEKEQLEIQLKNAE